MSDEETSIKSLLEKLTQLIMIQQSQMTQLVSLQSSTRQPTDAVPTPDAPSSPISVKLEGTFSNSMVMMSKRFSNVGNQERLKQKCFNCGRMGHIKDKCFEIVGYPN